jgi:hypothetical protein
MTRHGATVSLELPWVEASRDAPCPGCGANGDCCVLEDGEFVHCFAAVSCWPVADGGWLHRRAELTTAPV